MLESLYEITKYLFDCDYFSEDFDPEGYETHQDKAQELQSACPWKDIVAQWHNYLYTYCHTADEIINFANLFMYYGGTENFNPEPYKFLGYLYAGVDMDLYWEKAGDLFDSIAIDILSNQLLINLMDDPYYNPLKDKAILLEVEKWKNGIYKPDLNQV